MQIFILDGKKVETHSDEAPAATRWLSYAHVVCNDGLQTVCI